VVATNKTAKEIKMGNDEISDFLDKFVDAYLKEKAKIPYDINLVELLKVKANENAHSRILCKLLKYKNKDGKYEVLESLIKYIQNEYSGKDFGKITIVEPDITQQTENIDLWIKDKGYAIIFENKIKWATDQKGQLARYIVETLKTKRYREEQIYILYLPLTYEKEPDEDAWKYEGKNYKDDFKDRYLKLSFKDDILPWLREKVIPYIHVTEKNLLSALEQYTDYLDGKFGTRQINIEVTLRLQEYIKENLRPEDIKTAIKLTEKQRLKEHLNGMKQQLEFAGKIACLQEWEQTLKQVYPNEKIELTKGIHPKVCYLFNGYKAAIQYGINDPEPICGIVLDKDFKNNNQLKEKLKEIFGEGTKGSDWWYFQKKTTEKGALDKLKGLIDKHVKKALRN